MRPALYYAIRVGMYGGDIIAVTSEKPIRGAWFGRTVKDNTATHGNKYSNGFGTLIGRFDTLEAATAKQAEIKEIKAAYDARRAVHNQAVSRLYAEEKAEIEKVVGK